LVWLPEDETLDERWLCHDRDPLYPYLEFNPGIGYAIIR
jgi:hypothetical protein